MKAVNIFCDGGARGNPGPAASAFVVLNGSEEVIYQKGYYLGVATNNQAEYQTVFYALEWLVAEKEIDSANFYLDSQLVVNQLNGVFKIKEPLLVKKAEEIKSLLRSINKKIIFVYIPREKNFLADKLVNETLDSNR